MILELYFPNDMDDVIIQKNKKRVDWYATRKLGKETPYCLNPDLFQLSKRIGPAWELASKFYGTPETIRLVEVNPTHKEK